jgi:hypothetical protein
MGAHGELAGGEKEERGRRRGLGWHWDLLGEGEGHGRWGLDALFMLPVAAHVSSAVREKKKRRKKKGEENEKEGKQKREKNKKIMENFPNLKVSENKR